MKQSVNKSVCSRSQRKRLLERLKEKPLTTLEARSELDIMHPAARIQELKEQGNKIYTHWETVDGHRVAKYVLFSGGESNV